jgi:dihydroxy-acid dehydratase
LIELEVSDEEIAKRLAEYKLKTHDDIDRGFVRNFIDNVTQADEGCDLKYMQYVKKEK